MMTSRELQVVSMLIVVGFIGMAPIHAGESPCRILFERGTRQIQERPRLYEGDLDRGGATKTDNARRYERETKAALALWEQARKACLREAEHASTFREAAHWTSKSHKIAAEILQVQGNKSAACEAFATGIKAVEAVEPRSPHAAELYAHRGYCIAETEGALGSALAEKALELVLEAYGGGDARVVDRMIDLAVILPYSVAPYGDLRTVSGPKAQAVEQRVAELRRSAWEIVQADPNATIETIQRAAASFRNWQAAYGEDEAKTRRLEADLIAARRKQDGS